MNAGTSTLRIHRAGETEIDPAYAIVQEYYDAMHVVARDSREKFADLYFGVDAGVWLAEDAGEIAGCIALRPLASARTPVSHGAGNVVAEQVGEIKRLYVRPSHRGKGLAQTLLDALEAYAVARGYRWLYLDTTDEMVAATRFYERNQYERCARYNDNPQATIFFRKRLRPEVSTA